MRRKRRTPHNDPSKENSGARRREEKEHRKDLRRGFRVKNSTKKKKHRKDLSEEGRSKTP